MFFFNDTATTEIYTLSLHDALPISAHMHFMRRLTTELSGRPRCRLPHAEPANNLLAARVRPTIVHGPLQRVVRSDGHHCRFHRHSALVFRHPRPVEFHRSMTSTGSR